MLSKIYSVSFVSAVLSKGKLSIKADGWTNTSGWKHGQLSPWSYVLPPLDGVIDFDFLAEQPTGIVLQTFTEIEAKFETETTETVKGVRIHASQGSLEVPVNVRGAKVAGGDDDHLPWPW